jgi:type VI secretion system protein ImpG
VDLSGLEAGTATAGSKLEILFLIKSFERDDRWQTLETGVDRRLFRLGCTPVVNLFYQASEPILLKQTQYDYSIVPDARRARTLDVFSVDRVKSSTPGSSTVTYYDEFFSFRHAVDRGAAKSFWHTSRRPPLFESNRPGDVYLTLVDHSGRRQLPDAEAVTVELTCSNWTLPAQLPMGGGTSDFELEGSGPVRRIMALVQPTQALPAPDDPMRFWNVISHLSLNHLSLAGDQPQALQAILDLYNFNHAVTFQRQIQGIRSLRSRPHFARVSSEHGVTFARGLLVEMELDEENFDGGGAFLFASVLDRFLGMYASLNSFTQLVTHTRQRKEALRRWQPRAGRKPLV